MEIHFNYLANENLKLEIFAYFNYTDVVFDNEKKKYIFLYIKFKKNNLKGKFDCKLVNKKTKQKKRIFNIRQKSFKLFSCVRKKSSTQRVILFGSNPEFSKCF